jgi:phospholipid/cholesterol/gamma-HCH transport system permease protein
MGSDAAPELAASRPSPGTLQLTLTGAWRIGGALPGATLVDREIASEHPDRIVFDTGDVRGWDSALVVFAARTMATARTAGVTVDGGGLPSGVRRLLALAEATPTRHVPEPPHASFPARVGETVLAQRDAFAHTVTAIGELTIAFGKFLAGTAKFRRGDLWVQIQGTGASALGIVGLVAGLVGLIIAFIAAVQLQAFGATLYVASLVGIAMVRDLGAVMAGIVVAGRTGAAYAAELGTMKVTQELDAFATLGLSPFEFLVLPRVLAVTLMMPLLCAYADLLGVLGGAVVGIGVMHISPRAYYDQTVGAVSLTDLFGGLIKATTYGLLIGIAGCVIGLRSGRTAAAVGKATTSAVVAGIVLVIVACGTYAVVFYRLRL